MREHGENKERESWGASRFFGGDPASQFLTMARRRAAERN